MRLLHNLGGLMDKTSRSGVPTIISHFVTPVRMTLFSLANKMITIAIFPLLKTIQKALHKKHSILFLMIVTLVPICGYQSGPD